MKKITLFIFLLAISIGNSQTLPLDFSDPLDLMTGYDGCVVTIIDDAGNQVAQVVGGGQFYDTAQLDLSANLNLSDDSNNTITFMIKPVNGTTSGNHLLKFEGGVGGPVTTELAFTTTGTSWQTITLDFGAGLGNYSKVVLFTDFANNEVDTYLIDNIAGGTNIAPPPPLPTPSGPAPVPTAAASSVVSMYGETYPNTYQYSFGTATDVDLDSSSELNNALKIDFAVAGFGAGYTETDISNMQYVHFDYWTSNATTFGLYLISNNPVVEKIYRLPEQQAIVLNTWTSVNVPLSFFTNLGLNPVTWFQYKFDVLAATVGTVYFDNIYFTSSPLGIKEFDSSSISMYPNPSNNWVTIDSKEIIDSVSIVNVLGQIVLNKEVNNTSFTLDISNLNSGQYFVNIISNNNKLVKKLVKN